MAQLRGRARHSAVENNASAHSLPLWAELGFTLLLVFVLSFTLKTFVVESFYVPTGSMRPSIEVNDRVLVSKLAPGMFKVHRGDIIVFRDPGGWSTSQPALPDSTGLAAWLHGVAQSLGLAPASSDEFLLKRVIAVGGDLVECEGAGAPVTVNGVALDETYLMPGAAPSEIAFRVTVPEGAVWVMGDNREDSYDSRYHQDDELKGCVALDQVVGVAKIRLWPLSRLGIIRNPGSVFEYVPDPS
jgi:signal peptidase I